MISVVWNLEGYTGFFLTKIILFSESYFTSEGPNVIHCLTLNVVVYSVHTGAIHDSGGSTAKGGPGARSSLI